MCRFDRREKTANTFNYNAVFRLKSNSALSSRPLTTESDARLPVPDAAISSACVAQSSKQIQRPGRKAGFPMTEIYMNKLTCLLSLLLLCGHLHAQRLSIVDALHLHEEVDYRGRQPLKIVEHNLRYSIVKTEIRDKIIKTFDTNGQLTSFAFYPENSDSAAATITFLNDTLTRRKLVKTTVLRGPDGTKKETSKYFYDQQAFLTGSIDLDSDGNVIRKIIIACNEKGHPITLSLLDKNDSLIAKEKATYNYSTNKLLQRVEMSEVPVIVSTDSAKISLQKEHLFPAANEVFNSYGDKVKWSSNVDFEKGMYYEREYVYDRFGNWTESKIYAVTPLRNGERQREMKGIITREIIYE